MTTASVDIVRKSVTVEASPDRAFDVFTSDFDSWWPRSHHIGKSPMTKGIVECNVGGRCYSLQENGEECDWGKILIWEPPLRLVIAWMITHQWGYEPDIAKSSEVEVMFTPLDGGLTRVTLEHRNFERMGPGGEEMLRAVDNPGGGWGALLELYGARVKALRGAENA